MKLRCSKVELRNPQRVFSFRIGLRFDHLYLQLARSVNFVIHVVFW